MITKLEANIAYGDNCFVEGMAFAASGEVPGYTAAVAALRRLRGLFA